MKNLFTLLAAVVLPAGMLFGQVTGNSATQTQDGNNNVATSDQLSSFNTSIQEQSGEAAWGNNNTATILQTTFNTSLGGNTAEQYQYGEANTVDIYQWGKTNVALQQQGVGWAKFNNADIDQKGYQNSAVQQQRWDNNDSKSYQKGGYNVSLQWQTSMNHTASADMSVTNFADIFQDGRWNNANQNQIGLSNNADIDQIGKSNLAVQVQFGNGNKAVALQHAATWQGGLGMDNISIQGQIGDDNEAKVMQSGFDHVAIQSQIGNSNKAYISQWNSDNKATIIQMGDANWAKSQQAGSYNKTSILQLGNMNYGFARVVNGKRNMIDLTQNGEGNISTTLLTAGSDDNDIDISQTGLENVSGSKPYYSGDYGIYVDGDFNTVGLDQNGSYNVSSQRIEGDYNTANVTQLGLSNMATQSVIGNGNLATINQN